MHSYEFAQGATVKCAAALVLALACVSASAQPIGFKDLLLGKPLAGSGVSKKLSCRADDKCYYFKANHQANPETIAGATVDIIAVAKAQGSIQSIMVQFGARDFEQVREAMLDKYPAMKCERSQVQNRMGATFDQVECTLKGQDGNGLVLVKRASQIDESYVYFSTAAAEEAAAKQRAGTKKDL